MNFQVRRIKKVIRVTEVDQPFKNDNNDYNDKSLITIELNLILETDFKIHVVITIEFSLHALMHRIAPSLQKKIHLSNKYRFFLNDTIPAIKKWSFFTRYCDRYYIGSRYLTLFIKMERYSNVT